MDFILHATVCKHIHIVCLGTSIDNEAEDTSISTIQNPLVQEQECSSSIVSDSGANHTEVTDLAEGYLTADTATTSGVTENLEIYLKTTESHSTKMKAVKMCKEIEAELLNCQDVDAITAGMKHLSSALMVIRSMNNNPRNSSFPVKKRPAPNANCEKQFRFKSTKKKIEHVRKTLSKPNLDEMKECVEKLDEIEVDVCGLCLQPDDKTGNAVVNWVECLLCGTWYHELCVKTDSLDDFICDVCQKD